MELTLFISTKISNELINQSLQINTGEITKTVTFESGTRAGLYSTSGGYRLVLTPDMCGKIYNVSRSNFDGFPEFLTIFKDLIAAIKSMHPEPDSIVKSRSIRIRIDIQTFAWLLFSKVFITSTGIAIICDEFAEGSGYCPSTRTLKLSGVEITVTDIDHILPYLSQILVAIRELEAAKKEYIRCIRRPAPERNIECTGIVGSCEALIWIDDELFNWLEQRESFQGSNGYKLYVGTHQVIRVEVQDSGPAMYLSFMACGRSIWLNEYNCPGFRHLFNTYEGFIKTIREAQQQYDSIAPYMSDIDVLIDFKSQGTWQTEYTYDINPENTPAWSNKEGRLTAALTNVLNSTTPGFWDFIANAEAIFSDLMGFFPW